MPGQSPFVTFKQKEGKIPFSGPTPSPNPNCNTMPGPFSYKAALSLTHQRIVTNGMYVKNYSTIVIMSS